MILAFDTYYFENKAKTVCLLFESWTDDRPLNIFTEIVEDVEEYIPGEFYKRELPCILSLLQRIDMVLVEYIVIDGFVILDDKMKLGLGGYLYESLHSKIPVIGVAKTNFATIQKLKKEIIRGESIKPLYITSMGIDLELAASFILQMHGIYRFPSLLKQLDNLTKENN